MLKILERNQEQVVRDLDKQVREKWKWTWLDEEVEVKITSDETKLCNLGEFCRKVDVPGKALCTLCDKLINYGSRGKSAIKTHFVTDVHVQKLKLRLTNYTLHLPTTSASDSACSTSGTGGGSAANDCTYGFTPSLIKASGQREVSKPIIPLQSRVYNQQAMVLGVLAEHSLPFKMAPVLIDLAKELGKDRRALNELSMDRTSASIKTTYGLGKTIHEETIRYLRRMPFSLNIDEATGKTSNKRVVTVLVSYFNPTLNRVVTEHLESFEVIRVDAQSLFNHIVEIFTRNCLPWENLVSVLLDSCNVMRGKKSGLETRLHQKAPNLVDVDGDACHHIHNSCGTFCKPFDGFLTRLFCDIHTDFKWSNDLKEFLSEICEILNIKFTMPERFISHRWLSVYDVSLSTLRIWDALQVFYFGFLDKKDRITYQHCINEILQQKKVPAEGRQRIREIQASLRGKKLTEDGQNRKKRIIDKVLYQQRKSLLIMNFFATALGPLKEYVCLFQTETPMIHVLHDKQESTFREFLSFYLKPEDINKCKSAKQLKDMDLGSPQCLKPKEMLLGSKTTKIIKSAPAHCPVVEEFLANAKEAYTKCGEYMQKKLPLNSEVLRALSCIDPKIRGNSVCAVELKKLPDLLSCNLSEEEQDLYQHEVHKYQVDVSLPPVSESVQIDKWWAPIISTGNYPTMSKVVTAGLSIFHGPKVESSFSVMGDVIDSSSTRMNISTYSAIQTIKYNLQSKQKSAIAMFKRDDILHDPVDRVLVSNIGTANRTHKRKLEKDTQERMRKRTKMSLPSKSTATSKTQALLLAKKEEQKARLAHLKKTRERNLKLTKLAAERRKKEEEKKKLLKTTMCDSGKVKKIKKD